MQRCLVEDAGGVGIELSECDHGEISNSRVNGAGNIVQNLPGITIHDSPYGVVTRCEVMNVAHSRGIRYDSSADSGRYTNVSWNHIHDCGCGGDDCLSDGGGLDGMNTGSVLPVYLEHNWVHHINAHHFGTLPSTTILRPLMCLIGIVTRRKACRARTVVARESGRLRHAGSLLAGGAGIYADVSSNAMHITSNVVHDVADQVLYWNVQPNGKVPLRLDAAPFVVTNNLLVKNAMNLDNLAPWQAHTPIITWKGYTPATFERNIVYVNLTHDTRFDYKGGPIFGTEACAEQFKVPPNATCGASPLDNFRGSFDSNVYFNTSDPGESTLRGFGFAGVSLARWQSVGNGRQSVVADPLFVDGDGGDFGLRAGSVALAKGFVPWDYRATGPDW